MTYGNAVKQREEMIAEYKRMLTFETNPLRIEDIQSQIKNIESQMHDLKAGRAPFSKPKPLNIKTTILEKDPENPGEQKITIIDPSAPKASSSEPSTPQPATRLENSLRAKIMAAKAKKTQ